MWEKEDLQSGLSDTHRTMKELTSAMSSLVSFIQFEGEEPGMFPGNKLPTLDTAVWWNGKTLMYEFYEKPTVPNRVLQKDTALAESAIRSSLNQEVVRRMLNCSPDLSIVSRREFLSQFSQKLINSGFSVSSARIILVHGMSRYMEILRNSKLPVSSPKYRPIHFGKEFNKLERKLKKYTDKSCWYDSENGSKSQWRSQLPVQWKGSRPVQQKVRSMPYTSLLQVQNSANSRLFRAVAQVEPRLAKLSGYQVKISEKGGKYLSKALSKARKIQLYIPIRKMTLSGDIDESI